MEALSLLRGAVRRAEALFTARTCVSILARFDRARRARTCTAARCCPPEDPAAEKQVACKSTISLAVF
jgi:hypothetical protein